LAYKGCFHVGGKTCISTGKKAFKRRVLAICEKE